MIKKIQNTNPVHIHINMETIQVYKKIVKNCDDDDGDPIIME